YEQLFERPSSDPRYRGCWRHDALDGKAPYAKLLPSLRVRGHRVSRASALEPAFAREKSVPARSPAPSAGPFPNFLWRAATSRQRAALWTIRWRSLVWSNVLHVCLRGYGPSPRAQTPLPECSVIFLPRRPSW